MEFIDNPRATAAVPDSSGGIRFVRSATVPADARWGCFRYVDAEGNQRLARGPAPTVGGYDWTPDGAPAGSAPPAPRMPPASAAKPKGLDPDAAWESSLQRCFGDARGPQAAATDAKPADTPADADIDASWAASLARVTGGNADGR
jgi:hypothetical protein